MNARRKRRRDLERWRKGRDAEFDQEDYDGLPCCIDCGTLLLEWDYYSASGDGPFCAFHADAHDRGEDDDDDYFDDDFFEGDDGEPVGSCENCGSNLYADDDDQDELCDQCYWWATKATEL